MSELIGLPRRVLSDRYAFERELGRGGTATVYLARDLRHNRLVAVKVLRSDLSAALGPSRFLREIEIAAHLTHPHILPLHDSGEVDGTLYYVMPYVEGESLRVRLEREIQLPIADALRIAREVADALHYAHGRGVVHRDIKPENILLEAGHAVVSDFGFARAIDVAGGERLSEAGLAVGTPAYMSPEQAGGDSSIDGRSDLYSLGCVLYEMLAGEPPFTGPSAQTILGRQRTETPRSLRVVRPSIPASVESAVHTALAKVPADRFATGRDLMLALESGVVPAVAPPPARPRRVSARVIGLVVAAVVLVAVAIGLRARPPNHPGSVGVVILPFDGPAPASDSQPQASASADALFAEALGWLPALRPIEGAALVPPGQGWRAVPLSELLVKAGRLGAKYVVAGSVVPAPTGSRVSVELYAVNGGERVLRSDEEGSAGSLDAPIGRLALASVSALADREDLTIGPGGALLSSTSSASALGHILEGQAHFWRGDLDRSAAEFQAAVQDDSGCGLAYLRLSVVEAWRFDYAGAVATVETALQRRDRMAPRWVNLLNAQRYLMLGYGDSAISAFQGAVLEHRDDIDAWFGLGEALFHYGGLAGESPLDAQPALERVAQLDSTFAPIYDHLVDLAIYKGDRDRARRYLGRLPSGDPERRAREAAVGLRFGGAADRRVALGQLRSVDRQSMSKLVALYMHNSFNLGLADTVASLLLGPDRTPDDRRRGIEFRLAALTAQGHWPEAVAAWKSTVKDPTFDGWIVHAQLAGYPVGELVDPMYTWAESLLVAGRVPDFSRPVWDDAQQAFQALAHRAAVTGDSAQVTDLLRRIDSAPAAPDRTDPSREAFRAALDARLAMLARDTTQAIASLRRSVARVLEPWTWYYPLTAMAPQRLLLADLLGARGATTEARRWRDSFTNSWAVGDALFAARLRQRAKAPVETSLLP